MLRTSVLFIVVHADGVPEPWLSAKDMCKAYSLDWDHVTYRLGRNGVFRFDGKSIYKRKTNTKRCPAVVLEEVRPTVCVDDSLLDTFDNLFSEEVGECV